MEAPAAHAKRKSRFADTEPEATGVAGAAAHVVPQQEGPGPRSKPAEAPAPEVSQEPTSQWVEQTAEVVAEEEAVRRRREKLAQWKAKQHAASGAGAGGAGAPPPHPPPPDAGGSRAPPAVPPPQGHTALQQIRAVLQENAASARVQLGTSAPPPHGSSGGAVATRGGGSRPPPVPSPSPSPAPPAPSATQTAAAPAPMKMTLGRPAVPLSKQPPRPLHGLHGPSAASTGVSWARTGGAHAGITPPPPHVALAIGAGFDKARLAMFGDDDADAMGVGAAQLGRLLSSRDLGARSHAFLDDEEGEAPARSAPSLSPSPDGMEEEKREVQPTVDDGMDVDAPRESGQEEGEEEGEDAYYEAFREVMRQKKQEEADAEARLQHSSSSSSSGSASVPDQAGQWTTTVAVGGSEGRSSMDVETGGGGAAPSPPRGKAGLKRARPADAEPVVAPEGGGGESSGLVDVDEEAALYEGEEWAGPGKSALDVLKDKLSAKVIKPVDHSKVAYEAFPKCFYVEHPEVSAMRGEEVAELRLDAEIAVRGKAVPRPIRTWEHSGLPAQLLAQMPGRGFNEPFAIQKQALPVIMSGRDMIGVARTGSGKTLAYVLPLLRHVMAQEPLGEGEGPLALVLAPARELVVQIFHETRRFANHLHVRAVAVYGGAPVAEQIGEMKRGCEVLIATPGRLIDLLTLNAGKLLSFHRVTYVVLDEADRMFDLGFEPQVAKILSLIRPDRQTVMFSATFPTHVEALARKALVTPAEVVVGGRSKASCDVSQWVEVRGEGTKFARTLQLLGEWYERGSILVFVDTQERCDELFAALFKAGYPALSLHGGKDQADRDQALADFKAGLRTLLVATSVAGRGLDVKNLVLVINYSCPNHLEDYVHRVGRTGRAGTKGTAFTFITPGEGQYGADLIRALKDAKQEDHVPAELRALAEEHGKAVADGTARKRSSGYTSSKGFKFDASELDAPARARKVARQAAEIEAGIASMEDILEEADRDAVEKDEETRLAEEKAADAALVEPGSMAAPFLPSGEGVGGSGSGGGGSGPPTLLVRLSSSDGGGAPGLPPDAAARAALVAASIQKQLAASGALSASAIAASEGASASAAGASDELEINDYPQQARYRLLKEGLRRIEESAGVAITSRGVYVAPGRKAPPGERKLYLVLEGKSALAVRQAKAEARRVLEEETLRLGANLDRGGPGAYGKYNV